MTRSALRIAAILCTAVLVFQGDRAWAQRKFDQIPGGPSKSNTKILDLFKSVVAKTAESTVAVLVDGKQVALGTVVRDDGYILTKDSELRSDNVVIKFKDNKEIEARRISSNETW